MHTATLAVSAVMWLNMHWQHMKWELLSSLLYCIYSRPHFTTVLVPRARAKAEHRPADSRLPSPDPAGMCACTGCASATCSIARKTVLCQPLAGELLQFSLRTLFLRESALTMGLEAHPWRASNEYGAVTDGIGHSLRLPPSSAVSSD